MKIYNPRNPDNICLVIHEGRYQKAYDELFTLRCKRVVKSIENYMTSREEKKMYWLNEADKAFRVASNMKSLGNLSKLRLIA